MRGKLLPAATLLVAVIGLPNRVQGTGHYGTRLLVELDQLDSAIQAYKEKYLVYPPCMGESDLEERKRQFMEHLTRVYPSSTYGVRAVDFDTLNNYIRANYSVAGATSAIGLDLTRLDQAEALVFWLGGFPTPVNAGNQSIAGNRLFGFNRDTDSPMKRSLTQEVGDPLATRTNPRFDFRQEHLVDNDGDGWWEYLPILRSTASVAAPFVYFDSATYRRSSTSPDLLGTVLYPTDPELAAVFGTIVPFAASYDPANKLALKWQNPDSFQIVCGGYDGRYSAPSTESRIELFPGGKTYRGPTFAAPPVDHDDLEADNLTNLARTTLSGDEPQPPVNPHFSFLSDYPEFVLLFAVLLLVFLFVRHLRNHHWPKDPRAPTGKSRFPNGKQGPADAVSGK
jgi:hypothetical protein